MLSLDGMYWLPESGLASRMDGGVIVTEPRVAVLQDGAVWRRP